MYIRSILLGSLKSILIRLFEYEFTLIKWTQNPGRKAEDFEINAAGVPDEIKLGRALSATMKLINVTRSRLGPESIST